MSQPLLECRLAEKCVSGGRQRLVLPHHVTVCVLLFLMGTVVPFTSGGDTREPMSNEWRLFDVLAAAPRSERPPRKTHDRQVCTATFGIVGAVEHCTEFDPILVHRASVGCVAQDFRRRGRDRHEYLSVIAHTAQ